MPAQPGPPRFPAGPTDAVLLAEALAELERMVGLEPVKRQVKALSAQLNMARLRASQGLPVQPPKRHFVFSGPSGTGKTTVARILGRVFYALGLLGGDHLVEAQRADLVGEFLGQTAVKANELIDSALGGVLFVDEAYSLSNSGYSKGDAYGDEALQVLLKRAEDNRDHLVVILAGYPEGMDRLLAANPGLSSRFTTRVDFPSYRPLELTSIGEVLAGENGDAWDEEALDELRSISGHVVDQGWIDELGNGRFLRTLYEKSCAYRDLRLSMYPSTPDPGRPVHAAAARSDAGVRRGPVGSRPRPPRPAGSPAAARLARQRLPARLFAARLGEPGQRGGLLAVGGVADLAHQHFQHVLQGDEAEHPARRRRRPGRGGSPRGASPSGRRPGAVRPAAWRAGATAAAAPRAPGPPRRVRP